jgi:hypothetical protein
MKKTIILICLVLTLLLSACLTGTVTTAPTTSQPLNNLPADTISAATLPPGQAHESTEVVVVVEPSSMPASSPSITPPQDWFVSEMDVQNMHSIVVANQDVAVAEESFSGLAAAALVTTPLSEGSDPQALLGGMAESLPTYTNEDFVGLLTVADQIGLIDLSSDPAITFTDAHMDTLAGLPAVFMDGSIGYPNSNVRVQVWLCWTANLFVAYYQAAENQSWQTYAASFDTARNSIVFP